MAGCTLSSVAISPGADPEPEVSITDADSGDFEPVITIRTPATPPVCPAMEFPREDRDRFKHAEKDPPRSAKAWKALQAKLGDYPLLPYIEYARLRRDISSVSNASIESFLEHRPGGAVEKWMRERWLGHLAARGDWQRFIQWYSDDDAPITLRCHHALALHKTGQRRRALDEAEDLWLFGQSRPKVCDPIFATYLSSGRFSDDIAWQRIGLAMEKGNLDLVRYLERFLGEEDRHLSTLWRRLHRNPNEIAEARIGEDSARAREVLRYGIDRLARKEPLTAADALLRLEERGLAGGTVRAAATRRIALTFALRRDRRALQWMPLTDPVPGDHRLLRWRVASAALHEEWPAVLEGIAIMPSEERKRERWLWWRARALEETGDEQSARRIFESLAKKRDYYGFLAADRIDASYRFNHEPITPSAEIVNRVASLATTRRALELMALGRTTAARREWRFLLQELDEEEILAASWIADCSDWHGRAIATIARIKKWDDLELRFPLPYREAIEERAMRHDLSSAVLFALIRQESAFIPDIRSGAGAIGLMQIMPKTGQSIARSLRVSWRGTSQLLSPSTNLDFGSYYLRRMLNSTKGSLPLAAASYNAGLRRVKAWLPKNDSIDAIAWIDNIPFAETRRYVRRVLTYAAIYEYRLGLPITRLRDRLPEVPRHGRI